MASEDDYVPLTTVDLNGGGDQLTDERAKRLVLAFREKFPLGPPPRLLVRVPGRVNIIGEHIDYCGFGVLPMAIEQSILVAVAFSDAKGPDGLVTLANVDESKYAQVQFSSSLSRVDMESGAPKWHHYFQCGFIGVLNEENAGGGSGLSRLDIQVLVEGTIPPSAGLSSSSALVVAAALATQSVIRLANGSPPPRIVKSEMANRCAAYERAIGTQGGGMDQAIALLARRDAALHIRFAPLTATPVALPTSCCWFILDSGEKMNKAATQDFNRRVVETRLVTALLAERHGIAHDDFKATNLAAICRLKDIPIDRLAHVLDELVGDAEELPLDAIAARLGLSVADLVAKYSLPALDLAAEYAPPSNGVPLRRRARHVATEAARVVSFADICASRGGDASSVGTVAKLADLISASHASCRDDYECSSRGLDEVVGRALAAGALAARMTGAGWGGCAIALVPREMAPHFAAAVAPFVAQHFETCPSAGAEITLISQ